MDRVASIALVIEIIDIVYMSMIEMTSVASCNQSFSGLGVICDTLYSLIGLCYAGFGQ